MVGSGHMPTKRRGSHKKMTKLIQNPHVITKPDHAYAIPSRGRLISSAIACSNGSWLAKFLRPHGLRRHVWNGGWAGVFHG
jgi:hypothetical protein